MASLRETTTTFEARHLRGTPPAPLSGARSESTAAAGAGFADQAHLTRTMRRMFGVTPGAATAALR